MPSRLVCITSPASVIYVPSFAACPDSESEDREELELEVDEGPTYTLGQPSSSKSSTTQVRKGPRENDTTNLSSANPGDHETPTLVYPDLPEKSFLSPQADAQQGFTGYKDGNIRLLIGTQLFLLHEHKLAEFSILKRKVEHARQSRSEPSTSRNTCGTVELCLDEDPDDFAKMVEILYMPVYKHVSSDAHLKSTLRLATKFDHQVLRSYAIRCLEERNLPPIERIALAQNSNVYSWRKEALAELCTRDESITLAEANILGMKTFVELAHRRETYKLSRKSRTSASNETMVPQDPPRADLQNQPNLRPRGRPRTNPSDYQTQTSGTSRRSTRTNFGKRCVEPYRTQRAAPR
ncbi:unnamed protein product [Rhizoctonia solani]|uniref:BTB domain-containing protein n=1 Tax=Rhizoctonia solani TaxID=456999 RepID=A0A8H3BXX0_9AGAM|nr:unnamed protein product [Rhizoctonia solani]